MGHEFITKAKESDQFGPMRFNPDEADVNSLQTSLRQIWLKNKRSPGFAREVATLLNNIANPGNPGNLNVQ